jgi:hypothetical protein
MQTSLAKYSNPILVEFRRLALNQQCKVVVTFSPTLVGNCQVQSGAAPRRGCVTLQVGDLFPSPGNPVEGKR